MFSFNMINKIYYTEIPTKDETSKTTVQNLYCLFTYFHDILQLYTYFFFAITFYKILAIFKFTNLNLTFGWFNVVFAVSSFVGNPVYLGRKPNYKSLNLLNIR